MMIHHDGHMTQLMAPSIDAAKKIVKTSYVRSPGQETQGIISGFDYPPKPYAGQFWFKTSTNQLFLFNATTDVATKDTLPTGQQYGSFAYNRSTRMPSTSTPVV